MEGTSEPESSTKVVGTPGKYSLEWALQPPAHTVPPTPHLDIGPASEADSLLILPPQTAFNVAGGFAGNSPNASQSRVNFEFLPNQQGRLATIKVTLDAETFADAVETGWKLLAPFLSAWAFGHDVPLDVARLYSLEEKTGVRRVTYYRLPYRRIELYPQFVSEWQLPQWYHSLVYYREALASISPHYQFLCFYKAAEVVRRLRSLELKMSEQDGNERRIIEDRFREDEWSRHNLDSMLLAQVRGQRFNAILQDVLRPVRNRIAHAFEDEAGGKSLPKGNAAQIQAMTEELNKEAEALLSTDEVYRYLPLAKAVARRMNVAQFDIALPG